jgi:hypothetical protein
MLAPFCTEEGGRWRKKKGPFNVPKIPNNMLATLSAMEQLSAALWDKEGKERPLEFMLRPASLPATLPHEPMAVLSYLQVGESMVFGFNQKPSWKKIKFSWQTPYWAAVGAEFTTGVKSSKIKRTIEIPTSSWSFYRLLQKTKKYAVADDGKKINSIQTLKWAIRSPAANGEDKSMDIVFDIKSDPWAVFKLSR